MSKKILIPLLGNDVAPRFDLATEVLMTQVNAPDSIEDEKIMVLQEASAEKLCHLILTEGINVVICGGIEEEYYKYLVWKKVEVIDSIVGLWSSALERFASGELSPGEILF